MEMEYEQDLEKLEGNVGRLLGNLESAQTEKQKMKDEVARLEAAKKELEIEVRRLKDEKKLILQRVSALIGSIEKWEKTAPAAADVQPATLPSGTLGKAHSDPVQGVLVGN